MKTFRTLPTRSKQAAIVKAIGLRKDFEAAVEAGLAVAAEHGHQKLADIALHIRIELDRRNIVIRRGLR